MEQKANTYSLWHAKQFWVAISECRGVKLAVEGLLTTRFHQNNHDTEQRLTQEKNATLISCACPQTIFVLNLHLCPIVLLHFHRLTHPPSSSNMDLFTTVLRMQKQHKISASNIAARYFSICHLHYLHYLDCSKL